jgi:hypothetical protein
MHKTKTYTSRIYHKMKIHVTTIQIKKKNITRTPEELWRNSPYQ